ncbi:hypothetical protein L1857_19290 [Amycolatopsis thermalba]|uniref:Uncharacterized protein n=1 Tax=Amycolatopsis thermalba TaxID=944492 RepID=A0ABY4NXT2_9PSEU|nr:MULTISPECIES: hypothetical protein [Amycolatopsis]UQS24808.1 hypothetical protein L1857_19290 [Amycolatopsis thermalba]
MAQIHHCSSFLDKTQVPTFVRAPCSVVTGCRTNAIATPGAGKVMRSISYHVRMPSAWWYSRSLW